MKKIKKHGGELADVTEQFPKTNKDLLQILSSLLEFNPYLRPTAKELLKHPIFNKIRIKPNEFYAPYKIVIDIDKKRSRDYDRSDNGDEDVKMGGDEDNEE